MKKLIKFVGVILMLLTLIGTISIGVSAKEKDTSWKYNEQTKTLTILGEGKVEKDEKWNKLKIKNVKIEEGVEEIGNGAFSNLKSVKNISLPKSVIKIGFDAFENTGIEKITIRGSVKTIYGGTFYRCKKLKKVNWYAKEIPSYAFSYCSSLKNVKVSSKLESIGTRAFSSTGIEEFSVPNSVKTVGDMAFANCKELKKLVFSKNMETIPSRVVFNCHKLENVEIKQGTKTIGKKAFSTSTIQQITIPNSVTNIKARAFYKTGGIKKIAIPENITRIRDYTFYNCKDLETIKFNTKVKSIGENAFARCKKLGKITIPGNVTSIEYKAFEKSSCTEIVLGEGVEEIDYLAFNDCNKLEKVVISSTVSTICDSSFANCDRLTQITVAEENKTYTSVDNCLLSKDKTELLLVPGGKSGAYEIPATVVKVYPQAFYGCKKITSYLATNNSRFKSIDGILYDSTATKLISCPIGKTGTITIPSTVTIIGESAFQNSKANNIIIPDSVIKLETCVFEYCNNLEYIKIPGSVEKVSQAAFWECNNLKKVVIENGTKKIQRNAFYGCNKLKKIIVPISVYFINDTAFSECYRVSIYCKKSSCAMAFANRWYYDYKVI